MSEPVIVTNDLTKRYGDFVAVDNLNLTVNQGEIFGVLGPNGSGKTTSILMILGLTEPTEGSVQVLSLDPARQPLSVKKRTGFMPVEPGFYDQLTAHENLIYIAKLNGIPRDETNRRMEEVLAQVGLTEAADQAVGTYSHGMQQRLGVAEVLLKEPELIIMDEPTDGLDPEGARAFLEIVRGLKERGITIVLASHLLHQVQAICDRVGLFNRGKMVLEGTVPELAQRVLQGAYRIQCEVGNPGEKVENALRAIPDVVEITASDGNRYEFLARRDLRAEAAEAIVAAGGRLLALDLEQPALDEIYAQYFQEVKDVAAA